MSRLRRDGGTSMGARHSGPKRDTGTKHSWDGERIPVPTEPVRSLALGVLAPVTTTGAEHCDLVAVLGARAARHARRTLDLDNHGGQITRISARIVITTRVNVASL